MTRRTLDLILTGGGALFAIALLAVGLVLQGQANFAKSYEKDQLGDQKIIFTSAAKLTPEEKNWRSGSTCLTKYADQVMETGKQAECYANFYIRLHMENSATSAGFPGETYATLGGIQTQLRTDISAAKDRSETQTAADLQKKLDSATSLRSTLQTGETLRGLLLTSYGFSIFGDKAALAADIIFAVAGLMGLITAAGVVHAFVTPRDKKVWLMNSANATN